MKGIIALDIDGTLTLEGKGPAAEVVSALKGWSEEGWSIIFITGRSYLWAKEHLGELPFPYALAPQNGALLREEPGSSIHYGRYLGREVVERLQEFDSKEVAFYLGDEEERVFWNPKKYQPSMEEYLRKRADHYRENWIESEALPEQFISLKWFGPKELIVPLAQRIEEKLNLHCPAIRDPYNREVWIALATHPLASKGEALAVYAALKDPEKRGRIIAAGDDFNDLSLLMAAEVGVAMPWAPPLLKERAHIIAESGLVEALTRAIKLKIKD